MYSTEVGTDVGMLLYECQCLHSAPRNDFPRQEPLRSGMVMGGSQLTQRGPGKWASFPSRDNAFLLSILTIAVERELASS